MSQGVENCRRKESGGVTGKGSHHPAAMVFLTPCNTLKTSDRVCSIEA